MRHVPFNKYQRRVVPQPDRRAEQRIAQVDQQIDQLLETGDAWHTADPWIGKYAAALAQLRSGD